ncbi:MAG: alpha/beta fold hydrolase [Dehalococcoidia bacterium]
MARLAVAPGVALDYDDVGTGGPPFVFIHGLACERSAWAPQVADLSRDHRCVSVDLRGRGASDAVPPYGIFQQAEDVASLMRALALGPSILVGHSLGGFTALEVNQRYPELVLGVVAGDSPLGRKGLGGAELRAAIEAADSTEPLAGLIDRFWGEASTPEVQEAVRAMMLGCPPEVAGGMMADDPGPEGMRELVRAADRKPFMAIWADGALIPQAWLYDACMFLRHEKVAGAGHFFQLERPEVTNALLRAFLDDVERDPRLEKLGLR